MCKSGTAVRVATGTSASAGDDIFRCMDSANVTAFVGTECDPATAVLPAGFECACASDSKSRVRTLGGFGTGSRSTAFAELSVCLANAVNPIGKPCLYDYGDMVNIRYGASESNHATRSRRVYAQFNPPPRPASTRAGSCGYYSCYPQYQALANSTGGRFYTAPLSQFSPAAPCENTALQTFYGALMGAACIAIPNMDSWKCALPSGPRSLSVGTTQGLVTVIMLIVIFGYWLHMRKFGSSDKNLFLMLADMLEMLVGLFICMTDVARRTATFLKNWGMPKDADAPAGPAVVGSPK
jgi:hypothetical protein